MVLKILYLSQQRLRLFRSTQVLVRLPLPTARVEMSICANNVTLRDSNPKLAQNWTFAFTILLVETHNAFTDCFVISFQLIIGHMLCARLPNKELELIVFFQLPFNSSSGYPAHKTYIQQNSLNLLYCVTLS